MKTFDENEMGIFVVGYMWSCLESPLSLCSIVVEGAMGDREIVPTAALSA